LATKRDDDMDNRERERVDRCSCEREKIKKEYSAIEEM
jgi:hypothetical protein